MEELFIDSGLINYCGFRSIKQRLCKNTKKWRAKNIELARNKDKLRRQTIIYKEQKKRWNQSNRDNINKQKRKWYKTNADKIKEKRTKLRIDCLIYLGNGNLCCSNCGFTKIDSLQVNHKVSFFAKGTKRPNKEKAHPLWRSILKMPQEKARAEYEILCSVCNFAAFYEEKYKTKWNIKHIGNRE